MEDEECYGRPNGHPGGQLSLFGKQQLVKRPFIKGRKDIKMLQSLKLN